MSEKVKAFNDQFKGKMFYEELNESDKNAIRVGFDAAWDFQQKKIEDLESDLEFKRRDLYDLYEDASKSGPEYLFITYPILKPVAVKEKAKGVLKFIPDPDRYVDLNIINPKHADEIKEALSGYRLKG